MKPALALSYGFPDAALAKLASHDTESGAVDTHDIYGLGSLNLNAYSTLLIGMHVDQRYLLTRSAQIASFLEQGGTVLANGHLAYPFLPMMSCVNLLQTYSLADLAVKRLVDHPIWAGISEDDLTFRRGVAGFYGHAWHDPPEGATVIHVLGAAGRPLDFIYRVGRGRVLFHGGNDLWQYGGADSTARIVPQLLQWIFSEERR